MDAVENAGWTETTPAVAGYYWWRKAHDGTAAIVQVVHRFGGVVCYEALQMGWEHARQKGGWWYGPLQAPGRGD